MSTVIQRTETLETITCYSCGVLFAMPDNLLRKFRETREGFWCPNGHRQSFTKSTEQKLKEELARKERHLEWAQSSATAARDQAAASERSNRALRGVNTRMKKRIAAGVCPCCQRTFQDLARHMSGQHPQFVPSDSGVSA